MRKLLVTAVVCVTAAGFTASGAFAAPNPSGTGQPSAECGDPGATVEPSGFSSGGFANAEFRYAGSEGSHSSDNSHAVSQYDVACYQVTSSHSG